MKKLLLCMFILASLTFGNDTDEGVKALQNGDFSKAAILFQKACDGGEALGCYNLGLMYANGQGVRQDYFKATELYKKACDLKLELGCENYKKIISQGY